MIMMQPRQRSAIKGHVFGARKDSCSCDPCDCNPCKCGGSLLPDYPEWRISGYFVQSGKLGEQPLSEQVLLALSQPEHEGSPDGWQEVFLVSNDTSIEQIHALLALFEADIDSMPAEVETPQKVKRSVYQTSMEYALTEEGPHLQVVFSPEVATLVHEGSTPLEMRSWTYDGPVALRGNFHRSSR